MGAIRKHFIAALLARLAALLLSSAPLWVASSALGLGDPAPPPNHLESLEQLCATASSSCHDAALYLTQASALSLTPALPLLPQGGKALMKMKWTGAAVLMVAAAALYKSHHLRSSLPLALNSTPTAMLSSAEEPPHELAYKTDLNLLHLLERITQEGPEGERKLLIDLREVHEDMFFQIRAAEWNALYFHNSTKGQNQDTELKSLRFIYDHLSRTTAGMEQRQQAYRSTKSHETWRASIEAAILETTMALLQHLMALRDKAPIPALPPSSSELIDQIKRHKIELAVLTLILAEGPRYEQEALALYRQRKKEESLKLTQLDEVQQSNASAGISSSRKLAAFLHQYYSDLSEEMAHRQGFFKKTRSLSEWEFMVDRAILKLRIMQQRESSP